ncbi:MAG: hypothetical protein AAGD10_20480 [Myxococcota bacterium]
MRNWIASTLITMAACTSGSSDAPKAEKSAGEPAASQPAAAEPEAEASKITLSKLEGSKAYPDAKLTMKAPQADAKLPSGAPVAFAFGVEGYELAQQTEAPAAQALANSGKGQHIHAIVDNAPYYAKYEPEFELEMEDGHHVVLAFLSRSYHESVKSGAAAVVGNLTVGEAKGEPADLSAPHLFYSRPKGTYVGDDTQRILLDFYLVNTSLGPDGNKVRATVNGQEFVISEWAPYVLEGLPMGELTVKLELIDAEGKAVPGPFNTVTRKVMLKAAEG